MVSGVEWVGANNERITHSIKGSGLVKGRDGQVDRG